MNAGHFADVNAPETIAVRLLSTWFIALQKVIATVESLAIMLS